ncbi:MAG TPA: Rieske (2Fe-2S) protein [Pseudonocardia sp.]
MSTERGAEVAPDRDPGGVARREAVIGAAALVGLSLAAAGCGRSPDTGAGPAPGAGAAPGAAAAPPPAPQTPPVDLARTSDIPVGGGRVFPERGVVVTQPAPGRFVGFSARCPHEGCLVNAVAGGTINCPCHGSRFAIADGSVVTGPATHPLHARDLTVQRDTIQLPG